MSKALIIAEKPSVAADIARALGGFTRHGDYFESDDYVLSSAVGHLLEIKAPDDVEVKRGKWSFANLPVIPPRFDLNPIKKGEERLKLLRRLIRRKDVTSLINACDAGREGELIFRLIVQDAKAKQPIRRLWLQSMTQSAIRDAFSKLRDDEDMRPLADAARCRSEADWLVGINGTRAMTAFNSRDGGFYLTTVGRVQTPTLAIVVEREEKIKRFVSRPYFEVHARFGVAAGSYAGRWFDARFRKGDDPEARAERIWDRARAEAIAAACQDQPGSVSEETKPSTQVAPLLFDLTSLQREANSRFGFSAKTTLALAQSLYERHKVLTYPRTDSRALPEDYVDTVRQTIKALSDAPDVGAFASEILREGWVKPNKRVFDNKKVSDHFAIIPTLQTPGNLSDAESRLYDMVLRRFLAIFYPAAEFRVTTRITEVSAHLFKTEGRVMVNPGWMKIYAKAATPAEGGEDDKILVAVAEGEQAHTDEIEIRDLATRPPARYTEATLLSAMEGAGKLVEDDELREAMAEKGLGTPATRAAIIEGLIAENYLLREGRELMPTAKATQLMTLLRGLGVTELTMPELTGGWEQKLARMEHGQLDRDAFMREIQEMTRNIVARAKNYGADTVPGDYATLRTPCPKCGGVVKENYKRFACTNPACDFSITKIPGGRQFEIDEVETLLTEKTLGPLQGFRSRIGRPFAAILKITPEHKLEFDFGQNDDADDAEPVDFSGAEALGPCPKCGARVFEHGLKYVCERSVGPERSCDFSSGKIILQQEVAPEQIRKLLAEGRTDLLPGFVSMRTRRKFKAYLVRGADGKVGFEFEPRPAKPGAKAGGKAAAGAEAKSTTRTGAAAKTGSKAGAKKPAARKAAPRKPAAKKPAGDA
ncbi:MAG: DNA topoisomerase III [Burkholderiaceae bacterium]|jgi:DNA topoisomerase-3|nr:DNA topoisomerase III [Burkholderiaceae bacterium]MEB2317466.1 DNA topoisomerase III [Pseudomonadota bacterium]